MLEVDRILVAVHLGNHWTCAMVDLNKKELCYYDSLGVGFSCLRSVLLHMLRAAVTGQTKSATAPAGLRVCLGNLFTMPQCKAGAALWGVIYMMLLVMSVFLRGNRGGRRN